MTLQEELEAEAKIFDCFHIPGLNRKRSVVCSFSTSIKGFIIKTVAL